MYTWSDNSTQALLIQFALDQLGWIFFAFIVFQKWLSFSCILLVGLLCLPFFPNTESFFLKSYSALLIIKSYFPI